MFGVLRWSYNLLAIGTLDIFYSAKGIRRVCSGERLEQGKGNGLRECTRLGTEMRGDLDSARGKIGGRLGRGEVGGDDSDHGG